MERACTALEGSRDGISLESLQIEVIAKTHVRAHDVVRTETSGTVIMSKSNMGITIVFPDGSNEAVVDNSLWRYESLPNTLAPSFESCNITRSYELITRVGLKYESQEFQVRTFPT